MSDKPGIERALADARDLALRLEGTSVRRVTVTDGDTTIEIEREVAAAAASSFGASLADPSQLSGATLAGGGGAGLMVGAGARMASGVFSTMDGADRRVPVLAPLVGTFYSQKQPGSPAFVEVGQVVEMGEVVCIVEAMKLMNEVGASEKGKVVEICVSNSDWVEYEQVLMYLEPVD